MLRRLLLAAACGLSALACGRPTDGLALQAALHRAPGVAFWCPGAEEAALLEARLPWVLPGTATRVVHGASEAPAGFLRVLLGRATDGPVANVLARTAGLGDGLADGLVLTREDPDRPGLPVTVVVASEPGLRLDLVDARLVGARPLLRTRTSDGRPVAQPLDASGAPFATPVESAPAVAEPPPLVLRIEAGRAELGEDPPAELSEEPWRSAVERALGARERLRALLPSGLPAVELVLHRDSLGYARATGGVDAAVRIEPGGERVQVLAAAGVELELAEALCAATVRRALGPPAVPWLPGALAVAASGLFRGRELEPWLAHLRAGRLLPDPAALLDPGIDRRRSPLVLEPARAALLSGPDGELALDAATLRALWSGELGALADRALPPGPSSSPRRAASPALRGLSLALDPEDLDPLDGALKDARRIGDALARARAAGAGAVQITVLAARDAFAPALQPAARSVHTVPDDLALTLLARAARREGLALSLVLAPLAAPTGTFADAGAITGEGEIRRLFEDFEAEVEHVGLLAERLEVELLVVGLGLRKAGRTIDDEAWRGGPERLAFHGAGWVRLLDRARRVFRGALSHGADANRELAGFGLWRELDAVTGEAFPHGIPGPGSRPGVVDDAEREHRSRLRRWLLPAGRVAREAGRPLVIETGHPRRAGSLYDSRDPRGAVEPAAQAEALEALAWMLGRAEREDVSVAGLFLFGLDLDPASGTGRAHDFALLQEPVPGALAGLLAP